MDDAYFIMPEEANLQLPDPSLLNYYKSIKEREYWVEDEINEGTLELVKFILYWNKEDNELEKNSKGNFQRKPIKIFFNSVGGSLEIAYTLYDIIRMSKTPIIGINMGYCMSAAAYIFLACHQRKMIKHSYFIFHQGSIYNLDGEFKQIIAFIKNYQDQVKELSNIIKDRTFYTNEEISDNIIREWYIYQKEALEKGVVHFIIDNIEEVFN